jgi:hypothetical protein
MLQGRNWSIDAHAGLTRYDDDFYAWTQYQAAVVREMPVADNRFDREHVAEEIDICHEDWYPPRPGALP